MQVSKMSSRGVNSTDTEACNFIMQALTGNQWSCLSPGVVCTLGDYVQEGCTVVCFLKESNQGRENESVWDKVQSATSEITGVWWQQLKVMSNCTDTM